MKTIFLASLLWALVVSPVWAQSIPIMPDEHHRTGDLSFGPILVPTKFPGEQLFVVAITPQRGKAGELRGAQTLSITLEISLNGGNTYQPLMRAVFHPDNQPGPFSTILPEPGNAARLLRGTSTLSSGNWRGSVVGEFQ